MQADIIYLSLSFTVGYNSANFLKLYFRIKELSFIICVIDDFQSFLS